ncbi:hypothetical protein ABKV19_003324 [Rosa sericea]
MGGQISRLMKICAHHYLVWFCTEQDPVLGYLQMRSPLSGVLRLFFLNGEQDLSAFLLVDLGIVKYPTYKCIVSQQIFSARDDLLGYEEENEGGLQILKRWDVPWEWQTVSLTSLACGLSFVLTGLVEAAVVPYLGLSIQDLSLDEKAEFLLVAQGVTTAAILGVLYTVAGKFQPLPQDIYRYDWREPFSLQRGWLLWAGIGLVGAVAAVALTGAATSFFSGQTPEREEDEGVHWGIQNGLHLSRSTIVYFKHNDMESLRNTLEEITLKNKRAKKLLSYIVVEAVYQSNSFGVLGKAGRGLMEFCGVLVEKIDIITAAMGHALAAEGGFCTRSARVTDHQRLSSSGYVFSASLPPYLASAAITAIDVLEENPDLITKLKKNITLLWKGLSGVMGVAYIQEVGKASLFFELG